MKNVLFVIGTRPEVIKLAPVIIELKKYPSLFNVTVAITAQHRDMLDRALLDFDLTPDHDLDLMRPGHTLDELSSRILMKMGELIKKNPVDYIVVQGDTTTACITSISAFYSKVKVVHVEAGLRTGDKLNPFPEEVNRKIISVIADLNFAPTTDAKNNLLREGIDKDKVWVTGNTVVDAIQYVVENKKDFQNEFLRGYNFLNKKVILITAHRRENFGKPIKNICKALKNIANSCDNHEIIYPVHPNPNIHKVVYDELDNIRGIHLIDPLSYLDFVMLMSKSEFILTDSGGGCRRKHQVWGKYVLVLREKTERPEGLLSGHMELIGTETDNIIKRTLSLVNNGICDAENNINPYGDGKASSKIASVLVED